LDGDGNAMDTGGDTAHAYNIAITFEGGLDENAFERALVYNVWTSADITFTAGDNNDTITSGNYDDYVVGGDGDDYIVSNDGEDYIEGGDGDDYVAAGDQDDTVLGGAGSDTIYGGWNGDVLLGGDGVDSLYGENNGDEITGGNGADIIDVGSGINDGSDSVLYDGSETGGADHITYFNGVGTDVLVFNFVLQDGNDTYATVVDGTNDIDNTDDDEYGESDTLSSLDDEYVVYNFTKELLGIDFRTASDVLILSAIEDALEDNTVGGVGGFLSGTSGASVANGEDGTDMILLFTEANGSGYDTAVVRYREGASAEADFGGELSLVAVLRGVDSATLSDLNFYA
jgi:hypothetical protein